MNTLANRNFSKMNGQPPKKKSTVAIVDDEPALRLLLNEYFHKHYTVITLSNGKECLEFVYRAEPEILVIDLNMPDMTGLEVIEVIRKKRVFDRMAIVVLSGEESSLERIKCLEAGADDFVVKPFNPRELHARINSIRRRISLQPE
jgi:DNA-binding response OmpR family regulator